MSELSTATPQDAVLLVLDSTFPKDVFDRLRTYPVPGHDRTELIYLRRDGHWDQRIIAHSEVANPGNRPRLMRETILWVEDCVNGDER